MNRFVLKLIRVLKSEYQNENWKPLVPLIQTTLNHSKSPSLGDKAPTTVSIGLHVQDPIDLIFHPILAVVKHPKNPDAVRAHVSQLAEYLKVMHQQVHATKHSRRQQRRISANRNRVLPTFTVGDFVMVKIVRPRDKTVALNSGSWRVVGVIGRHLYQVQRLRTDGIQTVHVERLAFYTACDPLQMLPLKEHILFHAAEAHEVEVFLDRKLEGTTTYLLT